MRSPPNSSLTISDVARIKRLLNLGHRPREIAQGYGMSTESIRRIARGETWLNVEPETRETLTTVLGIQDDIPSPDLTAMAQRLLQIQNEITGEPPTPDGVEPMDNRQPNGD